MRFLRSPHGVVIAVGYGLGVAALSAGLPEQIPPSWSISAGNTFWVGRPVAAFLLPTAAAVTYGLLRRICVRHPLKDPGATNVLAVYDAIMLRVILFVIGVHATVLVGLLGALSGRQWAAHIVPVMFGATMIGVGNLLPRTRPNMAIGIRTPRTLSDRAMWNRIHRIAGYLIVVLGCVIVLAAIAVPAPIGTGMILLVAPAALLGIVILLTWSGRRVRA